MRDYWFTLSVLQVIGWGYALLFLLAVALALWLPKKKLKKFIYTTLVLGLGLILPIRSFLEVQEQKRQLVAFLERQAKARAMFNERCKAAGEKIYRTIDEVEGISIERLRPEEINFHDQFAMNDPYGQSSGQGKNYLINFLRGRGNGVWLTDEHVRGAYAFIDLKLANGSFQRTRLSISRWANGLPKLNITFESVSTPSRYLVEWRDASSRQDRENWIACGSLRVRDTISGELLGERLGCMFDAALGSRAGERSPWAYARDNSCPDPRRTTDGRALYEAIDRNFLEKVLIPSGGLAK